MVPNFSIDWTILYINKVTKIILLYKTVLLKRKCNFWSSFHKTQLPTASVRAAISAKLLHEHTAKLKSEIDDEAGAAEDGDGQDAE